MGPAPAPVDDKGRLSPPFVEWMMGLPAGWVTGDGLMTRTQALKALGNAVVPQQAVVALSSLIRYMPPSKTMSPERTAANAASWSEE